MNTKSEKTFSGNTHGLTLPGSRWLFLLFCASSFVFISIGCQQNPFLQNPAVMQSTMQQLQKEQQVLAEKNRELQDRATALDRNNQELESLLAQSRQSSQLFQEQLSAVKEQLQGVAEQLAQVRLAKDQVDNQAKTLVASIHRRGGATIKANSSLLGDLPKFNRQEIRVRRDGDVIRLEISSDQVFAAGGQQLNHLGMAILDEIAEQIGQTYSRQIVGIEAHTSADPRGAFHVAGHPITVNQALAVYDYMVNRGRVPAKQLFVAGHGSNHPIVSNGSADGQRRNRRIEIVIYPETVKN